MCDLLMDYKILGARTDYHHTCLLQVAYSFTGCTQLKKMVQVSAYHFSFSIILCYQVALRVMTFILYVCLSNMKAASVCLKSGLTSSVSMLASFILRVLPFHLMLSLFDIKMFYMIKL